MTTPSPDVRAPAPSAERHGVTQTIFGRGPEHGEEAGNCMQAAIATVFGLPLDAVPHFCTGLPDDWWDRMNEWLAANLGVWLISYATNHPESPKPYGLHLMQGRTVRDSHHVVVGRDGVCVWDPHPSRAGLSEVQHIEAFVSVKPYAAGTLDRQFRDYHSIAAKLDAADAEVASLTAALAEARKERNEAQAALARFESGENYLL